MELQGYDWPGNIRELQNVIERAIITSRSGKLLLNLSKGEKSIQRKVSTVDPREFENKGNVQKEEEMQLCYQENILNALDQCNWKITGSDGAAILLGLKPSTLNSKIKKMGLKRPG